MSTEPREPTTTGGRGRRTRLSLVVPIFNEELALPKFFDALHKPVHDVLDLLGHDGSVELVIVDDGSRDRSIETALECAPDNINLKLIKLSRNFRKDNALAAGFAHATGDAVITLDVDLQDPPELIVPMVAAWKNGACVVNARRRRRDSDATLKRISSDSFYRIFNRVSDYPIEPDVGDFRLLDRKAVDVINALPERVRFMKGLFAWIGFEATTIEYDRPARSAGETKWNYWKLWNFALDGLTGSTTLPLRIWTYFGTAAAIMALLYAIFIIVRTVLFGVDVPGYASLMVAVLFFSACNLIALGVIGEYLGRMTHEVKARPVFVVDEIIERPAADPACTEQDNNHTVHERSDRRA